MGCKIGANAIRLHDQVVVLIARLFRSLRLEAIVEPIRLFAEASPNSENQRPDILIRHPRGFGISIILDVACFFVKYVCCEISDPSFRWVDEKKVQKSCWWEVSIFVV